MEKLEDEEMNCDECLHNIVCELWREEECQDAASVTDPLGDYGCKCFEPRGLKIQTLEYKTVIHRWDIEDMYIGSIQRRVKVLKQRVLDEAKKSIQLEKEETPSGNVVVTAHLYVAVPEEMKHGISPERTQNGSTNTSTRRRRSDLSGED